MNELPQGLKGRAKCATAVLAAATTIVNAV